MGDIVVFTQTGGPERFWVAPAEEPYWLAFWTRQGCPAARWREYREWGGFFPPHPESVGEVVLYPKAREAQRRRRSRLRS